MVLRLKVIEQPATAEAGVKPEFEILTSGTFVLGRNKDSDWVLRDDRLDISTKHSEIIADDSGFTLNDTSTNGVFLNRATARLGQPHKLADGDIFSIGRFVIQASLDSRPLASAPEKVSSRNEVTTPKTGGRNSDPAAAAFDTGKGSAKGGSAHARGETGMTFIAPADKRPTVPVAQAQKDLEPKTVATLSPSKLAQLAAEATTTKPPVGATAAAQPADVLAPLLAPLAAGLGLDADALTSDNPSEVLQRVGQLTRALAEVVAGLQADHRRTLRALGSRRIAVPLSGRTSAASFSGDIARELADHLTSPQPENAVANAGAALLAHQKALFSSALMAAEHMGAALNPAALAGGDTRETPDRKARLWDTYRSTWRDIDPDWPTGFLEAYRVMMAAAYDETSAGTAKPSGERR